MPSFRSGGVIAYEPDSWASDPIEAVAGTQYQRTHSFRAGAAVEQYELVMIDVSDSDDFLGRAVVKATGAADGGNATKVVGVTLHAAGVDETVEVVTAGFCMVQADGDVAASNPLTTDGTVDGQVHAGTVGTDHIVGVALEADGDTLTGHVWMLLYPRV